MKQKLRGWESKRILKINKSAKQMQKREHGKQNAKVSKKVQKTLSDI
jgi:hypothetical protein